MPRIWIMYLEFLIVQCKVTKTRHTFDRALRSLPITQHHRIWDLYLPWVRRVDVPEMAVRVQRRHLKLYPEHVEDVRRQAISCNTVAASLLTLRACVCVRVRACSVYRLLD